MHDDHDDHNSSQPIEPGSAPRTAELRWGSHRFILRGSAPFLALWIAHHQQQINDSAPNGAQLVLSWKGHVPRSITATIRSML